MEEPNHTLLESLMLAIGDIGPIALVFGVVLILYKGLEYIRNFLINKGFNKTIVNILTLGIITIFIKKIFKRYKDEDVVETTQQLQDTIKSENKGKENEA